LETEHDALEAAWDANDDPDAEYPERLREISDRIDEINENREDVWLPETLAIAGAVVRIDYHGKIAIDRGYVLPADRPKKTSTAVTVTNDDGTVTEAEAEETSSLSAALIESLTLHRTTALGAELVNRPDIALAALVHTMAAQDLLGRSSGNTCLEIFARTKSLRGVDGTKAFDAMTSAAESWGDRIPGTPDALWDWCLAQDQQVLLDLLAFCMARTVNAARMKKDAADDHRFQHADRLAATLKLDMTAWFTPGAENYFAKISKSGILEALREAKGDIAPAWNTAKKADLAAIAERQLAGSGWLPALLRKVA
jgi:ParB family chromosome partitioning protein